LALILYNKWDRLYVFLLLEMKKLEKWCKITERQMIEMFDEYPDLLTRKQTQELLHIGKNEYWIISTLDSYAL